MHVFDLCVNACTGMLIATLTALAVFNGSADTAVTNISDPICRAHEPIRNINKRRGKQEVK